MGIIDKIIKEYQEHFNKGNKTLGTLPNDWKVELEELLAEEYTRGFTECYIQANKNLLEKLEEAFNAGRTYVNNNTRNPEEGIYPSKWLENESWKYYDFEEYIKSKENEYKTI